MSTAVQVNNQATQELVHDNTLYAEQIAHIGNLAITNSSLTSLLALVIITILSVSIGRKIKQVPTGIQNALEMIIEGFLGIFDSVTGSRERSLKFAPVILSLFFFVLINNWMGLLPGVGSIGQIVASGGQKVFVPYLRGGTADLNTTLALATFGVVLSHILGVIATGWWKYLNKFINIQAILDIPGKIIKDPMIIFVNPIRFFVGLIEIVSELAKIVSLSFRLFGNIFAGEVLMASMSAILAFGIPIPFMFLEIFVGLIQALIFAMLVLTYITISTTPEEEAA
jgi:F-type H+-transporting ATPase subunit a